MKTIKLSNDWLFLIVTGIGWGGSISLTKIAAESDYHPMTLVFWQLVIATIALMGWMKAKRIKLPLSTGHLMFYTIAGVLGTALPNSLAYYIAPNLPAGVISISYAFVPMMTFALAVLLRVESFNFLRLFGVALGFIAILLLIIPNASFSGAIGPFWVLLVILAGFCYSCESVYAKRFMPEKDHPLTILTGMTVASLLIVSPIMLAGNISFAIQNFLSTTELALILSSLIHVGCYAGYLHLVRQTGAIFASQVAYIVTLSGVFWGMLIFSETYSVWTWGALAMAVAGLALVRPRKTG